MEFWAAVAGFFLCQIAFSSLLRWAGTIYLEVVRQPPEVRRAQVVLPLLLLHSGPWVCALLIAGAIKLLTMPPQPWHQWFFAGFIANLVLMSFFIGRAWRGIKARRVKE